MFMPQGVKCSHRKQEKDTDDKSGSLGGVIMAAFPQTSQPLSTGLEGERLWAAATFQPIYGCPIYRTVGKNSLEITSKLFAKSFPSEMIYSFKSW